jgi:hypothetical protein
MLLGLHIFIYNKDSMKKNVGNVDMWVRIVVGVLAMFGSVKYLMGWPSLIVLFLGIVVVGTGIARSCFVYDMLGVNTCKA